MSGSVCVCWYERVTLYVCVCLKIENTTHEISTEINLWLTFYHFCSTKLFHKFKNQRFENSQPYNNRGGRGNRGRGRGGRGRGGRGGGGSGHEPVQFRPDNLIKDSFFKDPWSHLTPKKVTTEEIRRASDTRSNKRLFNAGTSSFN